MPNLVGLLEAADSVGALWKVRVLPEGESLNRWQGFPIYYSKELLKRVAPKLEGVPAYIYQVGEAGLDHLPEGFRKIADSLIGNMIGWYRNPRVEEKDGRASLVADLYIHSGASHVRKFLKEAWEQGRKLGVSIVADGPVTFKRLGGKMVAWVDDLTFRSADPVSHPATGAEFLALLESDRDGIIPREARMEKVSEYLLDLADKIAPDLVASLKEAKTPLAKEEAVALVSSLMETLNVESFPEKNLRDRLQRLRETIESGDFAGAERQLRAILLAEELGTPGPSPEGVTQGTQSQGAPTSVSPEALAKLKAEFGEETAGKLLDLLGEKALAYISAEKEDGKSSNPLWEKLGELLELIKAGKTEDAVKLLSAILAGQYPSPYPYPKPVQESVYTSPEARRLSEVERRVAQRELEALLSESALPEPAKARLRSELGGKRLSAHEMQQAIANEAAYIQRLQELKLAESISPAPLSERLAKLEQSLAKLEREAQKQALERVLREQVAKAGLPSPAEERLQRLLEQSGPHAWTPEKIEEAVHEESEFVDKLIGALASQVTGMGEGATISLEESEKVLSGFFDEAFGLKEE